MRNQWIIWLFVIGAIVVVLFAFNYQGQQSTLPLSDLFPEDDAQDNEDIEYEFVEETPLSPEINQATPFAQPPVPAAPAQRPAPSVAAKPPAAMPAARPPQTTTAKPALTGGAFTIQVASFKDRPSADAGLKGLQAAGHSGYVVEKNLGEKGTWYRLYVGQFQTKASADEYLPKLKTKYKDSFVISTK